MSAAGATTARAETRDGDYALTARGVAKFTALVALLAILSDAAVGHALLWENDPYWTYWITKTFLIATVFGLGTAWLGTGVVRGAVIALAHTGRHGRDGKRLVLGAGTDRTALSLI